MNTARANQAGKASLLDELNGANIGEADFRFSEVSSTYNYQQNEINPRFSNYSVG